MKDGFVRVAVGTPSIRVADCPGNAEAMMELMRQAEEKKAKLLVLPELSVTGYTASDLLLSRPLLQGALEALEKMRAYSAHMDLLTCVGAPLAFEGRLYNCAVYLKGGEVLAIVPKRNLPNYSVYYEMRHFTPGPDEVRMVELLGRSVPFGGNLLLRCRQMPEMTIGTEKIVSLTPSGTLLRAGETLFFSDGLMKRGDFSFFLLDYATLYFADGDGKLQRVSRPVPYYAAANVRALVDQWMAGPQSYDSPAGLSPVAPQGLRDADLLGAAYKRGVLLLNFSAQLQALSQGMDAAQERLMIYSLVNTLCALRGVTRVALFVMGEQPDSLAGAVYLPGEFLPNLDLAH